MNTTNIKTIKTAKNIFLINPKSYNFDIDNEINIFCLISNPKEKNISFRFDLKKGAKLNFICINMLEKDEKLNLTTQTNHLEKLSSANTTIKSLMFQKAELKYNGNIYIPSKSKDSKSRLSHKNINLSKDTKVESTPSLEIIENQVNVSHSFSSGDIDKKMLYYIQSRGLKKVEAINVLLDSFIKGDIEKITNKKIKEKIKNSLTKTLTLKINNTCQINPCTCKNCNFQK